METESGQEYGKLFRPSVVVTATKDNRDAAELVRSEIEKGLNQRTAFEQPDPSHRQTEERGFKVTYRDLGAIYPSKSSKLPVEIQEMTRGPDLDSVSQVSAQINQLGKAGFVPPGILKTDWVRKHSEQIPSCVVLVVRYNPDGKRDQSDQQISNSWFSLQETLGGHSVVVKIVLVLFYESEVPTQIQVPEVVDMILENVASTSQKLGIEIRNSILWNSADGAKIRDEASVRVKSLSYQYYKDKAQKSLGFTGLSESPTNGELALSIRHNFKAGKLFEACGALDRSLKHYELAYSCCARLCRRIGNEETVTLELGSYSSNESKSVAEIVHYRICMLHADTKNVRAILEQFNRHLANFRELHGPSALIFQHWDWMMRQHLSFARIMNELGTTVSQAGLSPLERLRCDYLYHLETASRYAIKRREASQTLGLFRSYQNQVAPKETQLQENIDRLCSQADVHFESTTFFGGYPKFGGRGAETIDSSTASFLVVDALQVAECNRRQSKTAFQLLDQVFKSISRSPKRSRCTRLLFSTEAKMARELMLLGRFHQAARELIQAAAIFHREQWYDLCQPIFEDIFLCAVAVMEEETALEVGEGDSIFDIDTVKDRRDAILSALRLLGLKATSGDTKKKVALQIVDWLKRPLKKTEELNAPDGAVLKLAFSLDDLQHSLFQWSVVFDTGEATVGDRVVLTVKLKSGFEIPTSFECLTIIFNDPRYEINLFAGGSTAPVYSNNQQVPLDFMQLEEKEFKVSFLVMNPYTPNTEIEEATQPTSKSGRAAMAKTLLDSLRTLQAIRVQLKLVGSTPDDRNLLSSLDSSGENTFFSGVSLWASNRTRFAQQLVNPMHQYCGDRELFDQLLGPRMTPWPTSLSRKCATSSPKLEVQPFNSTVEISLSHDGHALVGELYPLEIKLSANLHNIRNGQVWITCDPPIQSKSNPFFWREKSIPLTVDDYDFQPVLPVAKDVNVQTRDQLVLPMYCLFHSLPYPASGSGKQSRACKIRLDYILEGTSETVSIEKVFEIPCCLPFTSTVELYPKSGTKVLQANVPSFVGVQVECSALLEDGKIDVLDIVVEPSSSSAVFEVESLLPLDFDPTSHEAIGKKTHVSVLPQQCTVRGGDRLSVGFDVLTVEVGEAVVLGYIAVTWVRTGMPNREPAKMYIPLPKAKVEFTQFHFSVSTSPAQQNKVVGEQFFMVLTVINTTEIAQELDLSIEDAQGFFRAGLKTSTMVLPPLGSSNLPISLVPLQSGNLKLPTILVGSARHVAQYVVPSPAEDMVFVSPVASG